jgi:hypothetical protein
MIDPAEFLLDSAKPFSKIGMKAGKSVKILLGEYCLK